ncbi:HlyD family secretion protein [Vulcanococcus limneticus]|uniref:HlyD family secretion protein n=1 Tax=Vulcanococcus limneticus TaxID=2170428 RepID=UPI00398C0752
MLLRKQRTGSSLLVWTAAGATGAALLWAVLAPLPQTIAVQGKLLPGSRTRELEAPAQGLVEAVQVKEGDRVQAGQVLVRFDLRQARSQLAASEEIRRRLVGENRIAMASLGEGTGRGLTANQRQELRSQEIALVTRLRAAAEEIDKSQARIRGLEEQVATAADLLQRYRGLAKSGAISEVQVLDMNNTLSQAKANLQAEQQELARARANLENAEATPQVELRRTIETNLKQVAEQDRLIAEARRLIQYGELRAPVAGTVFDLTVARGSVVNLPATRPILKIVPQDALQARVFVPNTAIGFVRKGQRASLSLDAFPSTDFGRLPARVTWIGSDALTPEEQARVLGTDSKGLYFPATLDLDRQTLQVRQVSLPLQAGMSLQADLELRDRRFISVLTGFFEDKLRSLERLR